MGVSSDYERLLFLSLLLECEAMFDVIARGFTPDDYEFQLLRENVSEAIRPARDAILSKVQ